MAVQGIKTALRSISMIVLVLPLLLAPTSVLGQEQIDISSIEAFWEDSLAVLHLQVENPLTPELREALESGVQIQYDFDVYLTRTGYVKRLDEQMKLEYNVWSDRYRIFTPIGPLSINSFPTLMKLFRDDLILILHERDLPQVGAWFVKVRVEAYPIEAEEGEREIGGLERELRGLTGWLFRQGPQYSTESDWSTLTKLPEPPATVGDDR